MKMYVYHFRMRMDKHFREVEVRASCWNGALRALDRIGWDMETPQMLVERRDGEVDHEQAVEPVDAE